MVVWLAMNGPSETRCFQALPTIHDTGLMIQTGRFLLSSAMDGNLTTRAWRTPMKKVLLSLAAGLILVAVGASTADAQRGRGGGGMGFSRGGGGGPVFRGGGGFRGAAFRGGYRGGGFRGAAFRGGYRGGGFRGAGIRRGWVGRGGWAGDYRYGWRRPFYGRRFVRYGGWGWPYYGYGYGGCYRWRAVLTPYGWHRRLINVCYRYAPVRYYRYGVVYW